MAALALLVWLAVPASSRAGCGGVRSAYPRHLHGHDRPPLAIGDSTMLLALYRLADAGYEANAHGCREFPEAMALIRARRAAGTLPHMVVIALGADGSIGHGEIGRTLGLLCCEHLLVLVTPRELGGGSGQDAVTIREEAHRHHNRTMLLDWVHYSAGHPGWFQPDGLHLTTSGAIAFTHLLGQALPYAYPLVWRTSPGGDTHFPTQWVQSPGNQAHVAAAAPLSLRPSLAHRGYVGVAVTGPAGAQVRLAETTRGREIPLGTVSLPMGSAEIPRALKWRCDQRRVQLTATTLAPAAPASASAVVRTPSCWGRLRVAIDRRARVGNHLTIRLLDRWGIGGMPLRVCVGAPGARPRCNNRWLPSGRSRRAIRVGTPRPGGWLITVRGWQGAAHTRLVWAAHASGRLRMLAAGDSEMQLLDDFMRQDLGPRGVGVSSDARISTGLTKPWFFNWQAEARRQAAGLAPDVSVMFIGANDGFAAPGRHGPTLCCAWPWSTGYANLVAGMMRTYLRGGAGRVYWFTLPAPVPGQFSGLFSAVNWGIRAAARRFPGRVSVIDANAFFTPGNRYRNYMRYHGRGFVIHESDGVHLSVAADQVAARLVIDRMRADRVIR